LEDSHFNWSSFRGAGHPDHLLGRETSGDEKSLDAIEGEGTNYTRYFVPVLHEGSTLIALTYVVRCPQPGLRTSKKYVEHILRGLKKHDAPKDYLEQVVRWAAENNPELAGKLGG
jgi:hypothetical protein